MFVQEGPAGSARSVTKGFLRWGSSLLAQTDNDYVPYMAFEVVESVPLGRFLFGESWTPVWGAHVYPLRFFGQGGSNDPNDYLEVIKVITADDSDVALTRGGGLYARAREDSRSEREVQRVMRLLNLVVCELSIQGVASDPVNDTDIQMGKLIGHHIAIAGGWGMYGERTWGPLALLASSPRDTGAAYGRPGNNWWPPNFYWPAHDAAVLDRLGNLPNARALSAIGDHIPALTAAAIAHSSRHNVGETILTAWLVSEAIITALWRRYIGTITGSGRRDRLRDFRIYTASVQLETLLTAGHLDERAYESLHAARKIRNDLAHNARMSEDGARIALEAMKSGLALLNIETVSVAYTFQGGGMLHSPREADPGFPFR